jgi:hypothetical protein
MGAFGSTYVEDHLNQHYLAKHMLKISKEFVILHVLNVPQREHYFAEHTQILRMLTSQGVEHHKQLIVPIYNAGGKF